MNSKLKLSLRIIIPILLVVLTSYTTIKFREWFPPRVEIKVVFSGSTFAGVPSLRPVKDTTVYLFDKCDFTGRQYGEHITADEVDEAIAKIEKGTK